MSRRSAKNGEKRMLSKGAREFGREHEAAGQNAENAGKEKRRETNLSAFRVNWTLARLGTKDEAPRLGFEPRT